MKYLQAGSHHNAPIHSLAASAIAVPAKISEPPVTVLVVDDDPMVRKLQAEVLGLQGYNVLEAKSAAEALELGGVTATIQLLITDLAMPEVDGLELTRLFRKVPPKTPVLMVSGSLPSLCLRSDVDMEHLDFLPKPFHLHELVNKVRVLLEAASPLPIRKALIGD